MWYSYYHDHLYPTDLHGRRINLFVRCIILLRSTITYHIYYCNVIIIIIHTICRAALKIHLYTAYGYNTTGLYPCTAHRLSESISVYVINTRCGEFFLRCDLNNFSYIIRLYYTHTHTHIFAFEYLCLRVSACVYVCLGIV